ncbi:vegetative cell wall protein gp1-like, partial [Penaeus monodon]|uniref:vegetative cell wall protein gp1-like n=1 Tax=Penaeus monodon TaxID=6687 RepID=UPI0018A7C1B7
MPKRYFYDLTRSTPENPPVAFGTRRGAGPMGKPAVRPQVSAPHLPSDSPAPLLNFPRSCSCSSISPAPLPLHAPPQLPPLLSAPQPAPRLPLLLLLPPTSPQIAPAPAPSSDCPCPAPQILSLPTFGPLLLLISPNSSLALPSSCQNPPVFPLAPLFSLPPVPTGGQALFFPHRSCTTCWPFLSIKSCTASRGFCCSRRSVTPSTSQSSIRLLPLLGARLPSSPQPLHNPATPAQPLIFAPCSYLGPGALSSPSAPAKPSQLRFPYWGPRCSFSPSAPAQAAQASPFKNPFVFLLKNPLSPILMVPAAPASTGFPRTQKEPGCLICTTPRPTLHQLEIRLGLPFPKLRFSRQIRLHPTPQPSSAPARSQPTPFISSSGAASLPSCQPGDNLPPTQGPKKPHPFRCKKCHLCLPGVPSTSTG